MSSKNDLWRISFHTCGGGHGSVQILCPQAASPSTEDSQVTHPQGLPPDGENSLKFCLLLWDSLHLLTDGCWVTNVLLLCLSSGHL